MAGEDATQGMPFGRYRLIELLGRGGMGEVWRAHDTAIDRTVALKVLLPHFAQDRIFEQRFRREARAAARLDDPHVVPIYDVGEEEGRLYVTMRLIEGRDLQGLINDGPLKPQRAVAIIEQVAAALLAAHRVQLVHRDIKPSNILIAGNDFAYLIDFGIARAIGETGLTSTGLTVGTWSYMAPERFRDGDIGPSSDIYALTCVLYQCLTGQLPFPGTTFEQVAMAHMVNSPPKPSTQRRGIPAAMNNVIATGMAKVPDRRYKTALELASAARDALTRPNLEGSAQTGRSGVESSLADDSVSPTISARPKPPNAPTPEAEQRHETLEEAREKLYSPVAAARKTSPVPPRASAPWVRAGTVVPAVVALLSIGTLIFVGIQLARPRPRPTPPPAASVTASVTAPLPISPAQSSPPPPSTMIHPPLPTLASTTIGTTTAPSAAPAAAGAAMGLPCSSPDHGKLGHDPSTGREIFCHADISGDGTWEATPSDVRGVYIMDTSCEGLQTGDRPPLARSTNGYLITCEPASYADPRGGARPMWQRYRAIFDPGT